MSPEPQAAGSSKQAGTQPPACCPLYHEAVELIGRRWTGAIVAVLLDHGPMRFSETPVQHDVPPPTLGQHTEQVLRELLGKNEAEIARLRSEAII